MNDATIKRPRGGETWRTTSHGKRGGGRYVYINHRREGYVTYTYTDCGICGACLPEYDFVDRFEFFMGEG